MTRIATLRLTSAIGAGLMAMVMSAGAASAQAAGGAQDAKPAAKDGSGGLSEIVVTAQKREESLQRAALAVTAVSADQLRRAAVTDSSQLTTLAPALHVANAYGPTNTFYLRGVGNFVVNVSSDPAVIVNLDGVPLGRPTGVQGLFFDLQRIEVLKGPQGTLYGRNATGGAINVLTAQPKIGDLSGYANFSYGNFNAVKADAALNVPIGDNGAIRIAGMISKRDATYTDGTGDEDLKAIRFGMVTQPTDSLKITVGFDYAHQGGVGAGSSVSGLDPSLRIGLSDPRAGAIYSSPAGFVFTAGSTLPGLQTPAYQNNNFWGVKAQADLETSLGTISLIPAYREGHINLLTNASGLESMIREKDRQTSVELRVVSPTGNRLQYIFGGFYFNENDDSLNDFNYEYASFIAHIRPVTTSFAGYGRLTYSVTPKLRISGGLRYTSDHRKTNDTNQNQFVLCPGSFENPPYSGSFDGSGIPFSRDFCFGAPRLPTQLTPVTGYPTNPFTSPLPGGAFLSSTPQPNAGDKTFTKATWRAGIEYDLGDRSLLYASAESGYKAGGFFNSPDQANNSFKPESIVAYTIGSKNRLFNNRVQLNVEAFWWQYSDQQVSHFVNVGGVPVFATDNIGKSRYRGIEIETRAQVMSNTEINGTVQYLDARDTSFVYTTSRPPATGCATGGPDASGVFTVNCTGRRPANAPVWTVSAGLQQRIPLGEKGQLMFTAQTRYQSDSYAGIELIQAELQKGYFTTDMQLEYTSPDKKLTLAGFVSNIENNSVIGFIQPHNFAPGLLIQNLSLPRTYGIRAGVKF